MMSMRDQMLNHSKPGWWNDRRNGAITDVVENQRLDGSGELLPNPVL